MDDTATVRWLDRLAAAHEKASGEKGTDYRLAKLLGAEQGLIWRYRRRGGQMDEEIAARLADLVGVHPMVVIGEIRAEKSRDARLRSLWMEISKKAGQVAAVILAAWTAGHSATLPYENGVQRGGERGSSTVYYVKFRRWLRHLSLLTVSRAPAPA